MTTLLDQEFLIDVSEEDDSLLPLGDKAARQNLDDLIHSGTSLLSGVATLNEGNTESSDSAQELPLKHTVSLADEQANLSLPVISEDPGVVKKKKKSGFNVRKSMAWNNAFLSEEGVLDSEELSFVNKTFMKALGSSKQTNSKKPTSTKLQKPTLTPKISLGPNRVGLNAESKEHVSTPASSSFQGSMETLLEPHPTDITGHQGIKSNAKLSLSKGTLVSGKKESLNISAHANFGESKPPLPRRSPHKIEQAPNVFTSKSRAQIKHGVSDSTPVDHMEASRPTFTKLTMERLSSTSVLEAQPQTASLKLQSESSSLKIHPALKKPSLSEASGGIISRDKPSGLRKPSPKLGFFDMSRTGSQVAVLRERTNGFGGSVAGISKADQPDAGLNGLRSSRNRLEHSASPAKFGNQLLEASRNQNSRTKGSTRIPMALQVHGGSAAFASLRLDPAHRSSKPDSHSLNTADSTKRVYARKIGNAVIQEKLATSKAKGQENLSPDFDEATGMLQKCKLAPDLAMRKCSIQGPLATFKAKGQETVSSDFKEGMDVLQECEGPSLGSSSTLTAAGNACTSEVQTAYETKASPVKL